jgi:hypothetical protein
LPALQSRRSTVISPGSAIVEIPEGSIDRLPGSLNG